MRGWFGLALFAGTAAFAAPAPVKADVTLGFSLSGVTDKFEVLDVSIANGWAALKVVQHRDGDGVDTRSSVDCKYAGMSALPRSGVKLATWNLTTGTLGEAWVIYAVADDAGECTPQATSEAQLAAAKARFAALGLDIARKPAPITPKGSAFSLPAGDRLVAFTTATADGGRDDDMMRGTRLFRVSAGGNVAYEGAANFGTAMAGHLDGGFVGAFVEGDKAVFLGHMVRGGGRESDSEAYFLTPPLTLAR